MINNLLSNSGTPLAYILLTCECIIATFGIISIILGDNAHEKVHGIFVLMLALQGVFDFFFGFESTISKISLVIVTAFALYFIFMSLQAEIIRHKLRRKIKSKGYKAEIDSAKEEGSNTFDLTNQIELNILEGLYESAFEDDFDKE